MKQTYTYFWNGNEVSKAQAGLLLAREGYQQGYEKENWDLAFRSPRTEERREFIFDIRNCQLEIVVN